MILSWLPVVWIDMAGSIMIVILAMVAMLRAWQWTMQKTADTFRHYVFLLTTAFVVFAISRSAGHLLKQVLIYTENTLLWQQISPYSGAINTATFITIFALGIYFHRSRRVHLELKQYQDHLEELVRERGAQLEEKSAFLENTIESLKHPFYVIDALSQKIVLANSAAGFDYSRGDTCYQLTHGRDEPCSGSDHPCPLLEITRTGKACTVEHVHQGIDDERTFEVHAYPILDQDNNLVRIIEYVIDISERKKMEAEREKLIGELETALGEVKTLRGFLPICSFCKKIRDEEGYWNQIESYISSRSKVLFSHGICEECMKIHYPDDSDEFVEKQS